MNKEKEKDIIKKCHFCAKEATKPCEQGKELINTCIKDHEPFWACDRHHAMMTKLYEKFWEVSLKITTNEEIH